MLSLTLPGAPPAAVVRAAEFNFEIGKRVEEQIEAFMGQSVATAGVIAKFRRAGLFPNGMAAPDRDQFLRVARAMIEQTELFQWIYYGMEDGLCLG